MSYAGLNILMLSPEYWGEIRLSKHHFALAAAEMGAKVFFMQPDRSSDSGLSISDYEHPNIKLMRQPAFTKGLRLFPERVRRRKELKLLLSIEKLAGVQFDLIWNFDAFQFRFLNKADRGPRKHILHLLDYPPGGPIQYQAQNCDLGIGVRKDIVDLLNDSGCPTVEHIPHSYAKRPITKIEHPSLARSPKRLGYVGNLAIMFIDMEGLLQVALQNKETDVFLIGPREQSNLVRVVHNQNEAIWQRLLAQENVHWIGPVSWSAIPSWLDAMDGLLIAYDTTQYREEVSSPHKLMEYFASGKEVLSSFIANLNKEEEELILMMPEGAPIQDGVPELLRRIAAPNEQQRQQRSTIAEKRTYKHSTLRVLEQILTS